MIGDDDCDYLPVAAIQESVTGLLGRSTAFDSPDEVRANRLNRSSGRYHYPYGFYSRQKYLQYQTVQTII